MLLRAGRRESLALLGVLLEDTLAFRRPGEGYEVEDAQSRRAAAEKEEDHAGRPALMDEIKQRQLLSLLSFTLDNRARIPKTFGRRTEEHLLGTIEKLAMDSGPDLLESMLAMMMAKFRGEQGCEK